MKARNFRRAIIFSVFACFLTTAAIAQNQPAATREKIVDITKAQKKTDEVKPPATEEKVVQTEENKAANSATEQDAGKTGEPVPAPTPDAASVLPDDVPDKLKENRRGQLSEEEAAVVPYYNNFLSNYYLGPEDVISVEVFGHPNYSKLSITVPPTGRISYPLIREGVFVAGKTVEQVAEEVTKKLDEFIIDPKVTVTLDKAISARYSVLGDVGQPGVRTMTRRLSVYEAIAEAGGVLRTGNKKEVVLLRRGQDGRPYPIAVNLREIEQGKQKEVVFLVPGDQLIVPGNKIKVWRSVMNMLPIIGFARMFTGGL